MSILAPALDEAIEEESSSDVFTDYVCRSIAVIHGSGHPAPICEAASLGAIHLPATNYPLWDSVLRLGSISHKLSALQLEGVLFACSKHQEILPDGNRCGFFIGDGAGVGKGRQVSTIIFDNYARGRKRHLWLSTSTDLYLEARRDMHDIGCNIHVINGFKELHRTKSNKTIIAETAEEGVLFLTYASLTSTRGHNRLEQVLQWLGDQDFDGCICFDECHKAKSFIPGVTSRQTKIASTVIELQNRVPLARVLYCSATGVSNVSNMGYVQRLGLWGPTTAFQDYKSFYNQMKLRGMAFLEMLAMELKAEGKYIARSLSFRGAEFDVVKCLLTQQQVSVYNAAAWFWQHLCRQMNKVIEKLGARVRTKGEADEMESTTTAFVASYWATHQRFFRHLCVALKVPFVVDLVKQRIEEGLAVVIGIQSTGEAALSARDLSDGYSDTLIPTTKDMLRNLIINHFPPISQASLVDSQDAVLRECFEMKQKLLDEVELLKLPYDFLDSLIEGLGGSQCVAEMTGRRRLLEKDPGGGYNLKNRSRGKDSVDSINVVERQCFMSGAKRIAIVSDAGSTGISLHSDRKCANRRRRVHVTIELPWAADKAIQQLGRTHRSNQANAPIYQLISTNIGGENRFLSAIAKRLEILGALTRGDRRAASGVDLSEKHFDSQYGKTALKRMYACIMGESKTLPTGVSLSDIFQQTTLKHALNIDCIEGDGIYEMHARLRGILNDFHIVGEKSTKGTSAENEKKDVHGRESTDISRFFNRMLGMEVAIQTLLFNYFYATMQSVISTAKTEGLFIEGVTNIRGRSIQRGKEPEVLWIDPSSSLQTIENEISIDRGISYDDALELLKREAKHNRRNGFYETRKRSFGQHSYILAIEKPGISNLFKIYRASTGAMARGIDWGPLTEMYVKIDDPVNAEYGWSNKFYSSLTTCLHGVDCTIGENCQAGKRMTTMTVLSGSVVRIWDVLEKILSSHALSLKKSEHVMKIVRVPLKNEGHLIGVRYPHHLLPKVVTALEMKEEKQTDMIERLGLGNDFELLQAPTPVSFDDRLCLLPEDESKEMAERKDTSRNQTKHTLDDYFPESMRTKRLKLEGDED